MINYEFHASQLKDLIGDPLNYFYNKEAPQTQAMKDGTEREMLSYELFTKFECELDKNFQQQVTGHSYTINTGWTIVGTPDIVGDDYIVDIKNSIRSDKELIEAYKDQLTGYCLMFHVSKGYIFADANEGNDMDLSKCRLIEVPVDLRKEQLPLDLNNVVKALNENKKYCEQVTTVTDDDDLTKYLVLDSQIKALNKQVKALQSQQDEIMDKLTNTVLLNGELRTHKYSVRLLLKRNLKRIVQMDAWDGTYSSYVKVVKNKGE